MSSTEKGKPTRVAHLGRECQDFSLGCVKCEMTNSLSKGRGEAGSLIDGSGGRGSGLGGRDVCGRQQHGDSIGKRDPLRGRLPSEA